MLKKDQRYITFLIKKVEELQKDKREIAKSFFKALRLINKNNMEMEISPAIKEFCAYDIRIAKSPKKIKWKSYGGVRMWERFDKMGFPPERFLIALRILIKEVNEYQKGRK